MVVSRSQDLAERAYVEVNDSGTQCEIAVEIRHVADPLHATARDRFGAGLVKILIACLRQSLVKFAACDARNLILFLEPAPSKPVYVHHSSIYGVKRVITLLSSPAQQKLLSSFVGRRLTQYVI